MPFAAAVLLALSLGITAYRTGVKRGVDVAHTPPVPAKGLDSSLEEQASDAGHERAQLIAKLAEDTKVIDDLKRQLSQQVKVVNSLKTADGGQARSAPGEGQSGQSAREADARRGAERCRERCVPRLHEERH